MDVTRTLGLRINAPEWFADARFMAWLNDPKTVVFTWHEKGAPVGEWSDVVVLVDPSLNGEGADADMPEDIWDAIVTQCREHGLTGSDEHIPVRLTNV